MSAFTNKVGLEFGPGVRKTYSQTLQEETVI